MDVFEQKFDEPSSSQKKVPMNISDLWFSEFQVKILGKEPTIDELFLYIHKKKISYEMLGDIHMDKRPEDPYSAIRAGVFHPSLFSNNRYLVFMAFSRSLDTKAMAEYVTRHFTWDQRRVAFLPSPLPKDFQALCLTFELVIAKEAVEYYELPELPQVIFYVMLLNEAERLGGRARTSASVSGVDPR
ncbi:hypothetical protein Cgig2_027197 [Carnegiea gigantea]|uniref:Uncharacterized protein n=1 Tax=Carnegiea gigantea TaxID=171969 RepID=A0A9Q1KST2_9CARY|nr:hypothetical protein Cgig2_027197 [Carnegiea gigantea]